MCGKGGSSLSVEQILPRSSRLLNIRAIGIRPLTIVPTETKERYWFSLYIYRGKNSEG